MNVAPVLPSREDPVAAAASEWIGGPAGRHGVTGAGWWTPLRVALAVACAVFALGVVVDQPCHDASWRSRDDPTVWTSLCYSDLPFLYRERGFVEGQLPYWESSLEYPVLTGAAMQITAVGAQAVQSVTGGAADNAAVAEGVRFYELAAAVLGLAFVVVVVATARSVPRRPWDPLLVAASPVVLMTATINWDLLAVALTSLAMVAWFRHRPGIAGLLIGLGAAVKLYPVLLLGVMVLMAIRAHDRARAFTAAAVAIATAIAGWGAVNFPVMWGATAGWMTFFEFNAARGPDFGSVWYALDLLAPGLLPTDIDRLVVGAGLVVLGLVVVLVISAPQPPGFSQVAFLAVAGFILVNKVWSPQYSLWLLPLAVLAHPRWRALLAWQSVEVGYTVCVWLFLAGFYGDQLISSDVYAWVTFLRVFSLLALCVVVVHDVIRPTAGSTQVPTGRSGRHGARGRHVPPESDVDSGRVSAVASGGASSRRLDGMSGRLYDGVSDSRPNSDPGTGRQET